MRVLNVIDSLRLGGAEVALRNVALAMKGHHPDIDVEVGVLYERGPLAEDFDRAQVPVHCLGAPRVPGVMTLRRFARLVEVGRFDIVHTHLFPADYLVALFSTARKPAPVVVHTEHGSWNRRRPFVALATLERLVYSRFGALVGVSEAVCKSLRGWMPGLASRVVLIRNGVEVGSLSAQANGTIRGSLLFVGSFRDRVKGFDVLLEALASLPASTYPLAVVGDGPLRPAMERRAAELGLSARVEFLGHRRDVRSLMRQAVVMVMPSRWEGLPMVLLEAMAEGCPVVATAVGGIPEVVEHGVTGWLVQPDSPSELAARLAAVLGSPEERSRVASRAFERVARDWSLAQQVDGTAALYRELLTRARGSWSEGTYEES